jgi:hypothetical protein
VYTSRLAYVPLCLKATIVNGEIDVYVAALKVASLPVRFGKGNS